MRKLLSCLILFCISVTAWSQLSVGAGGNYTRFLGDYQKNTPGFHTRIQYGKGTYGLGLQYSYHVPFQLLFYSALDAPSTSPDRVDTKIDFRFQSLDFFIRRSILGNADSKAMFYGGVGASWVFLAYKEKALTAYSGTPIFPMEDGYNRSISVNAMLGSEYRLGNTVFYGEAGYSLPTKKRYIKHTINTITPRLGLQIGVKLPLN